jgi:OOP family OmpA-OmpF porin
VKPAPPPPPPPPAPKQVSRSFTLDSDALFAFDSATLSAEGRRRVNDIVAALRAVGFSATGVRVVGHTDPLGSDAHNQPLSERRAKAVADYLASQGVSTSILATEGRGERELRVTEADCKAKGQARTRQALIACLAPNRRVTVDITGTQR